MDWRKFLLIYLVMFIIGCMAGYLLEVFYRRFAAKKWVNPGFMRGPWLPLYGFGLLLMFSVCWLLQSVLPSNWSFYNPLGNLFRNSTASGATWFDLIVIVCMAISAIILEFVAGIIFVNGFKVRLWDYTNFKGNVKGVICPQFNLIWLTLAAIYYYGINPFIYQFFETLSAFFEVKQDASMLTEFLVIFGIGVNYGVMLIDFVQSAGLFKSVVALTKNNPVAIRYEKLREELKDKRRATFERLSKIIPESLKKKISVEQEKGKKSKEAASNWFKKLIYIDPNRNTADDEYDENGRPAKFD